ncbi:PEP-CTERM sorting domain-containing protein [Aliiglaciecola sp. LCG003]
MTDPYHQNMQEPTTLAIFALGLIGLASRRKFS